jgi:hypothetical protein
MAVRAELYRDRTIVGVTLFPEGRGSSIADDIEVPGFSPDTVIWWYWDEEKLMRHEREFLGIEVTNIAALTEADFAALDAADLPRIDSPEAGLADATLADVLRWAQREYLAAHQPPLTAKVS